MTRNRVLTAALIVTAIFVLAAVFLANRPAPREREIAVAAAVDLKFALDEIVAEFRRQHPEITVRVSYGSSGNFFAQLTNRAPFDIFFSADLHYPRRLSEQGVTETEFLYAVGRIVLWVPRSSPIAIEALGIEALRHPSVRKIAIANPQHAPYGQAAEAALKFFGVSEALKEKLVYGENVAQTAQFVQAGAADIGVIALALALAPTVKETGRYWEFPLESYPRMEQGGVILKWAKDPQSALALREFVLGPQGRAVLKKYGFFVPPPLPLPATERGALPLPVSGRGPGG